MLLAVKRRSAKTPLIRARDWARPTAGPSEFLAIDAPPVAFSPPSIFTIIGDVLTSDSNGRPACARHGASMDVLATDANPVGEADVLRTGLRLARLSFAK